ncbi:hypothetical protein V865_007608 [Kwoniella europaea PYCC6329]|uniref:RING-type domain-containing protein n=1 Tax=Kwoniella europaea PYCC6329 TaxID=1423913 RepID=A0AAX4KTC2_9TREE
MSEESDTSRPTRQAKKNAIRKIDKAVPREKKYKKKRKKEDQAAKELRQRYKQLDQKGKLARQQVEEGRHVVIDLMDDDSEEGERDKRKKEEREAEMVPFECVICSEEIIDVLSKAISEGKGGVDGGLAIWSCDQKDCGVLFCTSCVIRYITGAMARTNCPACRREWNLGMLRDQARAYDPDLLGEG